MHESRIAGLEDRLERLAAKATSGRFAPEAIEADRRATETELAQLRGLRDRNVALAAEAPALGAATDAAIERRRTIRERKQFTPGQGPTPSPKTQDKEP